jgi:predicted Ser/Thr protein kinase
LPAGALAGLCPACLLKQGAAADTAPMPGAKPFTPPSVAELAKLFPQLENLSLIGQGGMGAVYKARQPALDRFVALKILPLQAAPGVDFAERFNREARALAKLSHPNIVAVYDFGQAGALHYFIMEFVDGANLRQLIRSGRLAPREALAVVPQICDALQFAHDEGVVHRDIKPENILVDRRGRVKITDFGLAKILGIETGASRLTREGQVMGTPHYMAPEQVERPQTVDHRADIYSLGVVFYEMLTGELPLGKFPAPSQKVQVDVRLDEVVLHALEKEPERRYQQASEVKTAVETIVTTAPPKGGTPTVGVPASGGSEAALRQVKGPAIGLLATGIVNCIVLLLFVPFALSLSVGTVAQRGCTPQEAFSIPLAIGVAVVSLIVFTSLITVGALKMKRLESYGWAVAASMLAMFITPGNIIGLPVGIWALVVLRRPEVRAAFRNKRPPQEPTSRDTQLGRLALGLFIGGLLGTIAIMAMSPRQEMALVFGAVALVLALVFGLMGRRERLGRLAVFCTLAALVGLPASLFSAFWTEQACSIVTLLPRMKERKREMIERQEAIMQARLGQTTQDVLKDIQPDGTIRFKTTITFRNTTGEALKAVRFHNSDFIRVDKLTDARGRTIPFSLTRTGQKTFRYDGTLAEPVKPGAEFTYVMEGTETGLVKSLPQSGEFEYTTRHWPGSIRTRRIERHLLPAGAQLLSKAPADLAERSHDGRIELFIDRVFPGGDSLEVCYTFRLPTKP